ncbi:hypothetical protein OH76DRAFT_530634 [Lentinus brumalis]|uniref:Uncharacterized protein n=1 Tax=Lentinus brumalis TaxID=2498619 RepID=A0A371DA63_9APHY|nr:hypothetical protein OH76DRAFT_530634 [Polyporus brumalis]
MDCLLPGLEGLQSRPNKCGSALSHSPSCLAWYGDSCACSCLVLEWLTGGVYVSLFAFEPLSLCRGVGTGQCDWRRARRSSQVVVTSCYVTGSIRATILWVSVSISFLELLVQNNEPSYCSPRGMSPPRLRILRHVTRFDFPPLWLESCTRLWTA